MIADLNGGVGSDFLVRQAAMAIMPALEGRFAISDCGALVRLT